MKSTEMSGETRVCKAKECPRSGNPIPIVDFGKDKNRSDGLNTKCKSCVLARSRSSRKRKAMGIDIRKKQVPADHRMPLKNAGYVTEAEAVVILNHSASENHVEIRYWHDGTLSDGGIRPKNSSVDRWVPFQLKSCKRQVPTFSNCDKLYSCDILGVSISTRQFFLFPRTFVAENQQHLSGLDIRIGKTNTNVWKQFELDECSLWQKLSQCWLEGHGLTQREYEMQCSRNSQMEYCMTELAQMMDPLSTMHFDETRNNVTDRIVDGLKVQDKCASLHPHKALISRICRTSHAHPYVEGMNDVYCIHFVARQHRLYCQWKIPEKYMIDVGVVSGEFKGSGSILLMSCPFDERDLDKRKLQEEAFGGFPSRKLKSNSNCTSQFFRSMQIPMTYQLPT